VGNPDPYAWSSAPLLIVISGPSGAGKDSLLDRLKQMGCPFHFVVTTTTRPQRVGEVDGRDYHFVTQSEFEAMIEQGDLIEHARVYGDYKGVHKQQVREALASGMDVIMRLDVQGAATIRRLAPEAVLIFLITSTEQELFERLRARHTESPDSLQLRLATARDELMRVGEFDYVVVNQDEALDRAADDVMSIIRAEHCRVHPRRVSL